MISLMWRSLAKELGSNDKKIWRIRWVDQGSNELGQMRGRKWLSDGVWVSSIDKLAVVQPL